MNTIHGHMSAVSMGTSKQYPLGTCQQYPWEQANSIHWEHVSSIHGNKLTVPMETCHPYELVNGMHESKSSVTMGKPRRMGRMICKLRNKYGKTVHGVTYLQETGRNKSMRVTIKILYIHINKWTVILIIYTLPTYKILYFHIDQWTIIY